MNLFSENILQAICWTLLHSLWQALLLAMITGLVMVLSKKSSSSLRYNLLSCLFILFICVVGFTFYRQWQIVGKNDTEWVTVLNPSMNQIAGHASSEKIIYSNNILQNYLSVFTDYFNTHASLIVTLWFVIFMAKSVRILSGLIHIERIRHYKINDAPAFWKERISELANNLNIKKQILLLESAIIKVPVVVGMLKPAILVPVGLLVNLPPQEVESILIHELAHIRRRDYFFNLLQCFVDIIFFFNPAILWISSLIRNERENCCDDIAIHQTKNKKQFIQALVSFHKYNASVSKYAMPFAEKKGRLLNRVQRIITNNNHTLNPAEKIVLVISLFVFSVFFISISKGQDASQKKQESHKQPAIPKKNNPTPKNISQSHTPVITEKKYNSAATKKKDNPAIAPSEATANAEPSALPDKWQELGYKNISWEKAQELRDHGVSPEFISRFKELGFKNISLDMAQNLKDHGVNAEYINDFKLIGYKDISLERAKELRDHGVSPDFIAGFYQLGYKDISLDMAQNLRDHGVNPDFINSFYQMGYKDISLEKANDMRDHGVNASFVNSFHQLGFDNFSLDKAQELRDHGVNAAFVNEFKQSGFKNITLDQAIELRNHGVNMGFVESVKKKTGSDLSLDEYIILKDRL